MDCGPGDHPREPHSRPKHGLKRGVPSPPQSGWRVVSGKMPGAEVVHTFVATMQPDGGATTAPRRPRAIASWSDAILFGRVAGCRGADLPRLIEEPAEPRTQKRQGPPEGRAMNIRPRAGGTPS
jgi:hypothetical protein